MNTLEKLHKVLDKPIAIFFKRFLKYDVRVAIALVYSEKKVLKTIKEHIRKTDAAYKISKYLSVVFFQYIKNDKETKAACKNLFKKINDKKAILAYTEFYENKDNSPEMIINRLYQIFEQAVKNNTKIKSDKEFMKEYEKYHIEY